jgi:prophage antirepressor-like protein
LRIARLRVLGIPNPDAPVFIDTGKNQGGKPHMKNPIQVQQFCSEEFGNLDILMIDEKPYFPATECALILGYKNPHSAIAKHCRYLAKCEVPHPQNPDKTITVNYIPEGDLYRLIIRSKLPSAIRFESWVFDEVLPAIRRHGAYVTPGTLDELLGNPKFTEALIAQLDKERRRNKALEEQACEMTPKAIYYDDILQSTNAIPVSLIAKDYGMSAAAFNRLLHTLGVQYKIAGTWLLYQKYADKGYTKSLTFQISKRTSCVHTYWTQKGRRFLYGLLSSFDILPLPQHHKASLLDAF